MAAGRRRVRRSTTRSIRRARRTFYRAVRRYWPGLKDGALPPDYSGVRPKIVGKGEPSGDFLIDGPASHGVSGLVNLIGIESPGPYIVAGDRRKSRGNGRGLRLVVSRLAKAGPAAYIAAPHPRWDSSAG